MAPIATVCLSGTLEEKLLAAAAAGFDAVELFEPDLIGSPLRLPRGRRARRRAGPADRALPAVPRLRGRARAVLQRNLRRARGQVRRHGGPRRRHDARVLERARPPRRRRRRSRPSSCTRWPSAPPARPADRLRGARLGPPRERVRPRVADRRRGRPPGARRVPGLLPRPLARERPRRIRDIPADKLFFLQLADAPRLRMDVLQWSRHYRCFPGRAGSTSPASAARARRGLRRPAVARGLQRRLPRGRPGRTAVDAMRSLLSSRMSSGSLAARGPRSAGYAFAELARRARPARPRREARSRRSASATPARTAPSRCSCGSRADAPVSCSTTARRTGDGIAVALAVETPDARRLAAARAEALHAPCCPAAAPARPPSHDRRARRDVGVLLPATTGNGSDFLALGDACPPRSRCARSTTSPCRSPSTPSTRRALLPLGARPGSARVSQELAAPDGLIRSRARRRRTAVRLALNVPRARGAAPRPTSSTSRSPCDDALAAAHRCAAAGVAAAADLGQLLRRPRRANRPRPSCSRRSASRACSTTPTSAASSCTSSPPVVGDRLFFEVLERRGGYDGYGSVRRAGPHGRATSGGLPAAPRRLT